ncbi:MAG: sigma-70 family RNA polymerase sigma factor, partial [Candidatus Zixiibacteriota bacterium]
MQHLVIKAKQGDKAAERQLFESLSVRFVLLAKRRIGEEHCKDIAQEACITILEKLKTEAPEENFEAWAYKVLRNKIGNYLQSQNLRKKTMLQSEHIEDLDRPSTGEVDPVLRRRLLDCL